MMSDELRSYDGLSMGFAAHDTIKHSDGVYAKGNIHTAPPMPKRKPSSRIKRKPSTGGSNG